jgi:hypothetical protein
MSTWRQQPHLAGRRRAGGVARHGHEVQRARDAQRADQVGQEDERALQDAHQVEQFGAGVIALDLARQAGDAFLYLLG